MDHEVPQLSGGVAPDALGGLSITGDFYPTEPNIVPKPEPMAMPYFGLRASASALPLIDTITSAPMEIAMPRQPERKEGHVDISFCVEWTHKKGKRKPQQFWVYCEENQENYLRAFVQIAGEPSKWSNFSAVAKLKDHGHTLIFVQNMKQPSDRVDGLEIDLSSSSQTGHTGHWGSFPRDDLVLLSERDFVVNLKLIADNSQPLHPDQGLADTVHVVDEGYTDVAVGEGKFLPLELTYRYLFKNRSKGWFRVQATMEFNGQIVVEGKSDLFMFNNPRMVKKKDLVPFQSDEIKFMQCYALACQRASLSRPESTRAEWSRLGAGQFAAERLEEMLDKSHLTLTQKRKKSNSAGATPKASRPKKATKRSARPRATSALGKRTASDRLAECLEAPLSSPVSVGPLAKRRRGGPIDEVQASEAPDSWPAVIFGADPMEEDSEEPAIAELTDQQMDELVDSIWTPWG